MGHIIWLIWYGRYDLTNPKSNQNHDGIGPCRNIRIKIPNDFHYCSRSWNGRSCSSRFYRYGTVLDFLRLSWSRCHYATITNDCRNWRSWNNHNSLSFYVGMLQVYSGLLVTVKCLHLYSEHFILSIGFTDIIPRIIMTRSSLSPAVFKPFFILISSTYTQPKVRLIQRLRNLSANRPNLPEHFFIQLSEEND